MIKKFFVLMIILVMSHTWAQDKIEVIKSQGKVFLNQQEVTAPFEVRASDVLKAVGEKSFLVLQYPQGDKVVLRDGQMIIQGSKGSAPQIFLKRGDLFTSIISKKSAKTRIKTKFVSMGVRGTKFMVSQKKKYTYLCVCEGVVKIKNKQNQINVSAGEDTDAKKTGRLKTRLANDMMWKMAQDGFELMNINVGDHPKK